MVVAASCDTAIRLGNTGSSQGAQGAERAASAPRCEYSVREMGPENERVSTVPAERVRRWLVDSAATPNERCAAQIARVVPEFAEGETIPPLESVRELLRAVVRDASGPDALAWDIQHDGHHLRAHALAAALSRRGWNAHKLFALGALAPRDVDQRYFRRGGMLSDGSTTSDARAARRWIYHAAATVVVRVDGREGQSFPCPDEREQRCAFRVLDPSLRAGRATGTTDDAIGLLTVSEWARALRPVDGPAPEGVSLELARRSQVLPRALHGAGTFAELVVTDAEQCPIGAEALASRRALLRTTRHGDASANFRSVLAVRPGASGQPASLEIEGIDEALSVSNAEWVAELQRAQSSGALVTVTYFGATGEVRGVRVEQGTAPSVCLRAAVVMGD